MGTFFNKYIKKTDLFKISQHSPILNLKLNRYIENLLKNLQKISLLKHRNVQQTSRS